MILPVAVINDNRSSGNFCFLANDRNCLWREYLKSQWWIINHTYLTFIFTQISFGENNDYSRKQMLRERDTSAKYERQESPLQPPPPPPPPPSSALCGRHFCTRVRPFSHLPDTSNPDLIFMGLLISASHRLRCIDGNQCPDYR